MGNRLIERVCQLGLAFMVGLVPLPLGANRDWAWSPLAVLVGILALLVASTALSNMRRLGVTVRLLRVPILFVSIVLVWAVMQITLTGPEPWENPIRHGATSSLEQGVRSLLVLDQNQAWEGLMRLMTYLVTFLLAAVLLPAARRARELLIVIVTTAVIFTAYSMIAAAVNRTTNWTSVAIYTPWPGYFSGTFINRNNYATYTGLAVLASIALALPSIAYRPPHYPNETIAIKWRRRLQIVTGRASIYFAATAVLTAGVALSGSRGGLISLALGLMVLLALNTRTWRAWLAVGMVPLLLVLVSFVLPQSDLPARVLSLLTQGEQGRLQLWELAYVEIVMRPMFGWGANSFAGLFTIFQPASLADAFDKAHSSYLELWLDFGLIGAALFLAACFWVVVRCLRGVVERRRDQELPALGFAASVLVGTHAFLDFSLQIPAVAIVYAAILGMGWAQSWSSRRA